MQMFRMVDRGYNNRLCVCIEVVRISINFVLVVKKRNDWEYIQITFKKIGEGSKLSLSFTTVRVTCFSVKI